MWLMHAGRRQPGLEQQQQQQRQCTPRSLSLLPIDMFGQVFQWFPARKDPNQLSVRSACRWLRDAFDSCNTRLHLVGAAAAESKGSAQRRSYHALLQRLIARTSSLSSLSIKGWENGRELLKLPVPWGRLKTLDLSNLQCQNRYPASGKPKHRVFGPLAHCSGLKELTISSGCLFMSKPETLPFRSTLCGLALIHPSSSDLGSVATLFTELQLLVLDALETDTLEDKVDLGQVAACTGLRELVIFSSNAFENINGSVSSCTSLTQLTKLQLYKCGNLEDLQPIALLPSLRHLVLEYAVNITDISPLGSLRSSLEHLVITYGSFVGSEACLSSCTLLRHLHLRRCTGHGSITFSLSALSACTLLEYLDLSHCPVAGSLEHLLPCTRLPRLKLWGCRQVTALAPIASLVELQLSYCEELREVSPLTACVSLSTLYVSHCPKVKSLAPLAACTQLRDLRLSGCIMVTSLRPIAACTQLVCLYLNGCSGVKGLAPLSACRVLEMLQIGECGNLAGLQPLKACTALKRLGLSHSAKSINLAPLAACPSLQLLDLSD